MLVLMTVLVPMLMTVAGIRKQSVRMSRSSMQNLVHDDVDDESSPGGNQHHKGFLDKVLVDDPETSLIHHKDNQEPYDEDVGQSS